MRQKPLPKTHPKTNLWLACFGGLYEKESESQGFEQAQSTDLHSLFLRAPRTQTAQPSGLPHLLCGSTRGGLHTIPRRSKNGVTLRTCHQSGSPQGLFQSTAATSSPPTNIPDWFFVPFLTQERNVLLSSPLVPLFYRILTERIKSAIIKC